MNPLASLILLTYNQESYIEEAMNAALNQTYENLEIIISDDNSLDGTFNIIKRIYDKYNGRHNLIIRKNEENLGLPAHVSKVMEVTKGEIIISADGDDISYPHRVKTIVNQWISNNKESGCIFSLYNKIDSNGIVADNNTKLNPLKFYLKNRNIDITKAIFISMLGCTMSWTSDIFKIFGKLDANMIHQDINIPLRSYMTGSITIIQEELVIYRIVDNSLSRISFANSEERFKKMSKYWGAKIVNYEQYDTDKIIALRKNLISNCDIEWLDIFANKERNKSIIFYKFYSGNFYQRLKILLNPNNKIYLKMRLKFLILLICPKIYKYKLK